MQQRKATFCWSTHHPGLHNTRAFKYSGCICWKMRAGSERRVQANRPKYKRAVSLDYVPLKSNVWLKSLRRSCWHTACTLNRYRTSGDTLVITAFCKRKHAHMWTHQACVENSVHAAYWLNARTNDNGRLGALHLDTAGYLQYKQPFKENKHFCCLLQQWEQIKTKYAGNCRTSRPSHEDLKDTGWRNKCLRWMEDTVQYSALLTICDFRQLLVCFNNGVQHWLFKWHVTCAHEGGTYWCHGSLVEPGDLRL